MSNPLYGPINISPHSRHWLPRGIFSNQPNIPPTITVPNPHHSYGYQSPNTQFPFYPTLSQSTYTDDECYHPHMEANPPPQRPSFENMGTRLYESGMTRNVDLEAYMDPNCIHYERPSTQPQGLLTQQQPAQE